MATPLISATASPKVSAESCPTASLAASLLLGRTSDILELVGIWSLVTGTVGATYVVGAFRNVVHARLGLWRSARILLTTYLWWLLLVPAFVEGAAVVFALVCPARGFYVVRKSIAERAAQ